MTALFVAFGRLLASLQLTLEEAVRVQRESAKRIAVLEAENAALRAGSAGPLAVENDALRVEVQTLKAQLHAVGAFGFAPKKGARA